MTVAPVTLADEVFVADTGLATLDSSTAPLSSTANPVVSPLRTVSCAQSTFVTESSVVGSAVSPDIGDSCPVSPELSGILSSGLALDLEPHVGEADAPSTDDEGGDEDESQPGGKDTIVSWWMGFPLRCGVCSFRVFFVGSTVFPFRKLNVRSKPLLNVGRK